jgi:nitrilase
MSTPLKATAVQMASGPNVRANLFEIERIVSAAVDEGSNLIVLPENFAYMGQSCGDMLSIQERDGDGKLQTFLSDLARKHGVWLVGGTIPLSTEDENKVRAA